MSNLYMMLGCFGHQDGNFTNCSGIENNILKISPSLPNYEEILDYIDSYSLYDKPLINYNSIRNFLLNLNNNYGYVNKKIWSEKDFYKYRKFITNHHDCGLYIRLVLSDSCLADNTDQIQEKRILVKNILPENEFKSIKEHKSISIRGRRYNVQQIIKEKSGECDAE